MRSVVEDDGRLAVQSFQQGSKLRVLVTLKSPDVRSYQSVTLLLLKVGMTLQALLVLHVHQADWSLMLHVARGAGRRAGLFAVLVMVGRLMTSQASFV